MDSIPSAFVPFRSAGILAHITSLPGAQGIGDLGPAAYEFVDALALAGQTWWQILPLGPTGFGDSPYQALSAFAGSPNLISLELMARQGLIDLAQLPKHNFPTDHVDYTEVTRFKRGAMNLAWENFQNKSFPALATAFAEFAHLEAVWLNPFAQFMAFKEYYQGAAWHSWPEKIRLRDTQTIVETALTLKAQIEFQKFRQFLFFMQWKQLREYAHEHKVKFIGDLPIFVSDDSAEVWSRPELFQLEKNGKPKLVAGVPPDYFSPTGQRWGNPVYDWEQHRSTGFAWWITRLQSTLQLVDLVRLDHFRGFESYWGIPADSPTAEVGAWLPGPGKLLFDALLKSLGSLPLIAEDLGVITPEVDICRQQFNLPGMRILQFAFGGARENRFLPHNYERNTVVYTGTHDNDTTMGWYSTLEPAERTFIERYVPATKDDISWQLVRTAWASIADLAVAPLQDILSLGSTARMNFPGTPTSNWGWRYEKSQLTPAIIEKLRDLTDIYQRLPA